MKKKNEIQQALYFLPLTAIENPLNLLKEAGDEFSVKVTKTGKKVARLYTKEVKRTAVRHKSGKTVNYIF